jgi:hypothetical protein
MMAFDEPPELEIARIARAVSITSPQTLFFAGQDFKFSVTADNKSDDSGAALRTQLQTLIYQHCYCRRFDGKLGETIVQHEPTDAFVASLSVANRSQTRWSGGWTIEALNLDGTATVRRGAIALRVWPGEYHTHQGPGMPPAIGTRVSIFVPRESVSIQPGFYFAFGESLADGRETSRLVRFYWAISEDGVAALVRALTQRLNRFQIPFRFKCSSLPSQYWRLDPAVLYIDRRFYDICALVLVDVYNAVAASLREQTPLFSKQLARGLGLAEDPGPSQSFGMQRSSVVAEGMWRAFERGRSSESDIVDSVREEFSRRGLLLAHPYLNASSSDIYGFDRKKLSYVA